MSKPSLHRHANALRLAGFAAIVLALTACTTRPFQPPPPLYKLWAKPGVSEQGVRSAMLGCGYADPAYVDKTMMTTNAQARAELCMLDKGFLYQDRRILCADNPELPACASVPRGKTFGSDPDFDPAKVRRHASTPPAYSCWSRADTDTEAVKRAMLACGYAEVARPFDNMLLNDIAAAELCMVGQRFTYAGPAARLLCKSQPGLPACRGRAIDIQRCCAPAKAAGTR